MRDIESLTLIALASMFVACSPSPDENDRAQPESRLPEEGRLTAELAGITTGHLQSHLNFLAADARMGRMTGTEGHDEAAAYVAEQFELLGLQPAGDDGWFQAVPLISSRLNVESATIVVHREGGDEALDWKDALNAADAGRPLSTPLGIEVTMSRQTAHTELASPNVVGVVRRSDPELRDEYVVYSAHLDHPGTGEPVAGDRIYNGYYDNAMGIALMIEAARAIAAMTDLPRRSVLFIAGTGEERGLLGSDYFAHYPTVPPGSMVANVNLDMPLLLYPLADIIAFGAEHSSLQGVIETAIAAEDFVLTPDPLPEEVLFIRSDQYSFVRQGVPSVFLVPGFASTNPEVDGEALFREHLRDHYHRPSDDSSRPVDWDSALRFARANVRIGMAVAEHDRRPAWNEGDFFGARFGQQRIGNAE
jgi:hypothetical protein